MSEGHQYTDELKEFRQTMDKFEKSLEGLSADMKAIKMALLGSEYGEEGLVNRIQKAERKIDDLEDFKTKVYAYVAGLGAGAGALTTILINIVL